LTYFSDERFHRPWKSLARFLIQHSLLKSQNGGNERPESLVTEILSAWTNDLVLRIPSRDAAQSA
jgi:hypothetical protein